MSGKTEDTMGEAAVALELDALADKAGKVTREMLVERDDARERTIVAIRLIEQRLRCAIAGDKLRGLVDLSAGGGLQAACVRPGIPAKGIDYKLPWNGNEVLVISRDGELLMARMVPSGAHNAEWEARDAHDDDLRIEDMVLLTRAAYEALSRHVARTERGLASYRAARELADTLDTAFAQALENATRG